MYQFTKLMITDGNFIHLDQAQFFAHNYFSFFIINFVTRSVRHTGITAFVITRATDHMKRGAAVCDAELQLPEVREERERERGGESGLEQARPVESGFFLTWAKMNGPQFVALVHKSLKIVIAIYHESAGCNFIFNGWNFQRDPPLFSIRRDLPVIRNANRVQSFWQLRPSRLDSPPTFFVESSERERKRK